MMKLFNGFGIIGSVFHQMFMVFKSLINLVFKLSKDARIFSLRDSMLNIRLDFKLMLCRAPIGFSAESWLVETAIDPASIWKPSQLTRLLLNFDLLKAGQIDAELAKKFRRVQKENFSKMSKFSNFCNFLGSCNSGGIHLVAFYFNLHMFLCNKNYESAFD